MKKVEHTKQSNQPLILNENLNFSMDFSFWAAEVDLLSVLVTGKKAGIVLIVNPKHKGRYLTRLNDAIEMIPCKPSECPAIKVWVIDAKL